MNTGIQESAGVPVFNYFGIYPGVELLCHMVILKFIFLRTHKTFLLQLHDFTFTPAIHKGSNFPTNLPTCVIPFEIVIIASLVVVKWHFLVALVCIIFTCFGHLYDLFWRNVCSSSLPILNLGCLAFVVKLYFCKCSGYEASIRYT